MTFKIHYNGAYKDELVIKGKTIKEIKQKAFSEGDKRGWERKKCWSEQID